MGISTLVVGLGGTGVLAVRATKKLYGELDQKARASAGFLAIDFDRSALNIDGGDFAELQPGEFLYLDPEGIQVPVRNIDRSYETGPAWEAVRSWFPDPGEIRIPTSEVEANGAGQFRLLGRLGFFIYDDLIEKTLLRAYESLDIEIDSSSATRDRRVILAASIAGGTGSGMMIDLAYVIRRHLEGRPHVYAYLLLPEVFAEVDHGGRIYQNAYATLRELAHLKSQVIPFRADYFHIAPIDVPVGAEQPFSRIFLYGRAKRSGRRSPVEDEQRHEVGQNKPVLSAVLSMAQAIRPQLDRTLQEKSKAIAANTTASDAPDARRRLQMQCFSTSGGELIPLGAGGETINPSRLFYEALRSLNQKGLGELYAEEARGLLDRLLEQGSTDTDPGPRQGEGPRGVEKPIVLMRAGLQELAGKHARMLLPCLMEKALSHVEKSQDSLDNMSPLLRASQHLRSLVMEDIRLDGDDELDRSLDELGGEALRDFRTESWRWVERFVPHTSAPSDPLSQLQRWAYLTQLQDLLLQIDFNSDDSKDVGLEDARKALVEADTEGSADSQLPAWRRLVSLGRIQQNYALARLSILRSIDEKPMRNRLDTLLQRQAHRELLDRIGKARNSLEEAMRPLIGKAEALRRTEEAASSRSKPLRSKLSKLLSDRLKETAPQLLRELTGSDPGNDETIEAIRKRFLAAFNRVVLASSSLDRVRFDEDMGILKDTVIRRLVGMRQDIFVRRTPNPRRKGIAVASCPTGFHDGGHEIEHFLEVNAEQLLLCRCEVISRDQDRIWIYYEDLFNPPDHLRNIDDYYNAYRSQDHPVLFHIDRRFLELDDFQQIIAGTYRLVHHCGNPGCDYNLSGNPAEKRVCDGCGRPIRSRCGNPGCPEDALHTREESTATTCPSCGGFNYSAWWKCHRHGKEEVLVPIDKEHCPRCIDRHHDDPLRFPLRCVSKRPDLQEAVSCPYCERLHAKNPLHKVFKVHGELLRFYRNGVNGHDLERFRRLAETKYGLPDGFRCPHCRTHLIPVHHRKRAREDCP